MSRLDRLERANSLLKRLVLVLLVLFGVLLLLGQTRVTRTVEAEKLILKDSTGRIRARLEMEASDRPTLALLDERGYPVVSLGAGENPFLNLCSRNCENQATLNLSKDLVGLAFYEGGEGWNPTSEQRNLNGLRAGFGVVKGIPGLNLYGKTSNEQASLDLEAPGPRLFLADSNGNVSLEKASIELSDQQGFRTTLGRTGLESPRTGETHKTSAASIVLYGNDGRVLRLRRVRSQVHLQR
jgi:hypothetical protein